MIIPHTPLWVWEETLQAYLECPSARPLDKVDDAKVFVIPANKTRWGTPRRSWSEIQWAIWALRMKYGYDLPWHLPDKIIDEDVHDVLNKEPKFHETKFIKLGINTIKRAMKLLDKKLSSG
jgi:hypothetical protein